MGLFNFKKKVGNQANNNQEACSNIEIENQYFGKLQFHKDSNTGTIQTSIKKINFGETVLNIDIDINEYSNIGVMFDKLEYICRNSREFIQEVYPKLAEFCSGIDLYDENDQIIENFNEDLLMEKYKLKWMYVDTNFEKENIISIQGYICDNVDQEIAIQVNCDTNNITYELL